MTGGRERRLARLEQKRRPAAEVFYVWCHRPQETAEQAIARSFPDGVPANALLMICSWEVPGERENPNARA